MVKIWEYFCYFLYIAFFRYTAEDYRPYSLGMPTFRRFLVRQFIDNCGQKIRVKHNADISPNIRIGDNSELGTNCRVHANVRIGADVIMGPDVKIYSRNHKFDDIERPISQQGKIRKTTTIGDDVWIGANVIITPGVDVGSHSVIAAGAVVTKNVEEFSVVGGNPAVMIRDRRDA